MSQSITYTSPDLTSQHVAKAIVLRCSDFRMRARVAEFIDQKYNLADELVAPGGGWQILRDGRTEQVVEDIKILSGLHDVKHVVFINHTACGALKAFCGATPENEIELNADLFALIGKAVAEQLPGFTFEMLLVDPAVNEIDMNAELAKTEA